MWRIHQALPVLYSTVHGDIGRLYKGVEPLSGGCKIILRVRQGKRISEGGNEKEKNGEETILKQQRLETSLMERRLETILYERRLEIILKE
jgi:hypothetical protein